jgi:Zn-dependent peptidase ImmA (M78 family)
MTDLAVLSGVSARTLSDLERGKKTSPTAQTVAKLAGALRFPEAFFYRSEPPCVTAEAVSFRSLARMTAKNRDEALAAVSTAIELDAWIDERFRRPDPGVPDLRGHDPEAAAEAVRAEWRLGMRPIPNMIHLLEAHGVRVYSLAHDKGDMDAVSLWYGDTAFVFLNTMGTAERSRYDAAHELGHLVLHRHGGPDGDTAEREAHAFASSFLMPRADVLANAPRRATLPSVLGAKGRWGVSALALVYRMHKLDLLTDWHYRQFCITLRSQFGSAEPHGAPRESSQVLDKVFTSLRSAGVRLQAIANELAMSMDDLSDLVFSLTMLVPIRGGGGNAPPLASKRPDLRVV